MVERALSLEQVSEQHLCGRFGTAAQNNSLAALNMFSERDFVGWLYPPHLMKSQSIGLFLKELYFPSNIYN